MTLGCLIHRVSHLPHRLLEIHTHSTNQFISIHLTKPFHGNSPPGHSKPGTLFNHHDRRIGRPGSVSPWSPLRLPPSRYRSCSDYVLVEGAELPGWLNQPFS